MLLTMNEIAFPSDKQTRLRNSAFLSIGLSLFSLFWLSQATLAALDIEQWMKAGDTTHNLIGLGLFVTFLAHMAMLPMILTAIRTLGQARVLGSACLGLCSISIISLVSDWACLHDIVREYPAGLDISGEMLVLRLGLAATCVYLTFQIGLSVALVANLKNMEIKHSTRPVEDTFNAVNILGVLCASIGLTITVKLYSFQMPVGSWEWAVLPILCVVAMPYVLVLLSWLRESRKENGGLLDEKQKTDLLKGGTTSWLASIPITVALFIANYVTGPGPVSALWLPTYLFASLLIFSASTLYFFREA
jgi:hypothetical protein